LSRVALHEAGHAVALKALGFSIPKWITIAPDEDALGACQTDVWMRWSRDALTPGREWAGRVAVFSLSGLAAEERRVEATVIAEAMLSLPFTVKATRDAESASDLTRADRVLRICEPLEHGRGRWLAVCWSRAVRLMERERGTVEAVAAALLARKRVEEADVVALLAEVHALPLSEPLR
jgi:hypothetical protein